MGKIADISKWQGTIDWSKASKELDLAIIRVQYGSSTIDSKYKEYVSGAKKYNVPFGHYAYAKFVSVNDAIQEAKDFWARSDKSAQFHVVDVEEITTTNPSDLVPATQAFIDYLHSQGAKKVGLYSGDYFYKSNGLSKVKADFLWIARYGSNNGSSGTKPTTACDLWQYTSTGSVSGISGYVDLNTINGSKPLTYFTGTTVSEGVPTPEPTVPTTPPVDDPITTPVDDPTDTNSDTDAVDTSDDSYSVSTDETNDTSKNDNEDTGKDDNSNNPPPIVIPYDTFFINPNDRMTNFLIDQDKIQVPSISLATPNRVILGKISEADNKKMVFNFTSPNELSLSIPYEISIHNELVRNPIVDLVRERFLIKVVLAGIESWYVITKKEPSSDDTDWLNIQCFSLEYELSHKKIIDYKQTSFNCLQVLADCLKGTNWKVGYINDEFNLKYKQFDVSSSSKLDFINQICTTFDAYAIYDTVNRKVNICKEEEVSIYKGFWVEYGKYMQNISQDVDIDEIVSRLHISGSDDVSINSVNPTGKSYIDDFSYFLYPFERDETGNITNHSFYMTDELCNALLDYNNLVDENETNFSNLLQSKKKLQEDLTVLNNDLTTLKSDLQIILDDIQVAKDAGLPTSDLITQRDSKQTDVNNKQKEIDNKQSEINSKDTDISNLNKLISIENNLSDELLSELQDYIFEDEFSDNNQINNEDLYELSVKQLKKVCVPPINISLGIVNFFAILEEKHNWKRLTIGDIVRIKHDKLKIDVKATVNQLSFDFENNSISINVSNVKRPASIQEKLSNALYVIDKVSTDYSKRKRNWDTLLINFNLRNDRISTIPNNPVLSDTAITHKLNDNASADLTLTWSYNDYNTSKSDADNIDGFTIYMYSDTTNENYVFGSKIAEETVITLSQDKRTYTFPSIPPNRFYTLGIAAYRSVDNDIQSDGALFSSVVTASGDNQNPYLPNETVVLNGSFNGTINGTNYVTSDTEPSNPEVNNTVWTNPVTKQTQIYTVNGWEDQTTNQAGNADTLNGKSYQDIVTDVNNFTWNDLSLQNGWVNFGGTDPTAKYTKIGNVVYLKGTIKNGTLGSLIATLPSGFRPFEKLPIDTICDSGTGTPIATRIFISPDGTIMSASEGSNAWLYLSGKSFIADGN
jgi:GH25 family lysozyme M1 (1,4-beta-N-acetylmuramidase)